MIVALYAPTRGTDFVVATWVTDSPEPVAIECWAGADPIELAPPRPPLAGDGVWLWRTMVGCLQPEQTVRLLARQGSGRRWELETTTLSRPPGGRRLRFGILADPHCTRDRPSGARLFAESFHLLESSIQLLARWGAAFIVIPGDLTDAGTETQIEEAQRILTAAPVPVRLLIGNRDRDQARFRRAFDLGNGYYSFDHDDLHFVCLQTPSANDLRGEQLEWLQQDLASHQDRDTFLFSHYSLVRHPYLDRYPDTDSAIANPEEVGALLRQHPRIRAAFAGHKNIPCRTDEGHVAHLLCPQPVHYPCSADLVDVYRGGLVRHVLEIEELDLLWRSRQAHADPRQAEFRYGSEEGRNVSVGWEEAPGNRGKGTGMPGWFTGWGS